MRKKSLFLAIFLVFSLLLKAQQDPQFTQNMFTQLLINPGYAGSEDKICAYALQRIQWSGFDGAPSITVFNVDAAIKNRIGLGVSLENDELGFDKNFKINLSIAYKQTVGKGKLGIGIKWGVANSSISVGQEGWITPDVDADSDIAIPVDGSNDLDFLDFGFGLYYKTQNVYLGISSTHLLGSEFEFNSGTNTEGTTTTTKVALKRHYYLTAGYNLPFANPLLEFKPNIFVQSDGTNTQLSINALFEYNKKLWGGVSLRTDNAISGIFGLELFNWAKVSYSYDFVVSDIMGYNDGTHEIMMGFCLDVKKDKTPEKYKSIRFL
ncbi:MAG: type IX secretion system membrane protein PorP/SprF [Bacteroidales bacterium]|jgi:type IX secretion system PorP/SprF family membrane protein|nr:type IX secretion system membrane protein PorP/SprF [Bacteroidales bacterium]